MLNMMSSFVMPLMICAIVCTAMFKRVPVFETFTEGAKKGFPAIIRLVPTLVALMTAVRMFEASGAVDLLTNALSGAMETLHIPKELLPLALMRPVTGSGSLTILNRILNTCGADSLAGRSAAVIMASTETTFYTIAVYFGSGGIRKTGKTIPAALTADIAGFLLGCFFVRLMFAG